MIAPALRLLLVWMVVPLASATVRGQSAGSGSSGAKLSGFDPVEHWEINFESGTLWHVTGLATRLNYVVQPQILSLITPGVMQATRGGGDLVLRSRFSLLAEPIVQGPEHHYLGCSASGLLEWWDRSRTRCLFLASGGGFGGMDSKGYEIRGAQGQDFNFNWFIYSGVRLHREKQLSFSAGVYFQHISNGHLDPVNPGLNSLGPMLSARWSF